MSGPLEPSATPDPATRRRFLGALALGGLAGSLGTWLVGRYSGSGQPAAPARTLDLSMTDHEHFMRLALVQAKKAPKSPFGAVIVDMVDRRVLAEGFARIDVHPTFHGETEAIKHCIADHPGVDWRRLVMYTTGESCAMCQSSALLSQMAGVVYGSSMPLIQECGWGALNIRSTEVIRHAHLEPCALIGGVLAPECDALFQAASRGPLRKTH